jgi:hypothetical protein
VRFIQTLPLATTAVNRSLLNNVGALSDGRWILLPFLMHSSCPEDRNQSGDSADLVLNRDATSGGR